MGLQPVCRIHASAEPWLAVNPNKAEINVEAESNDPDSVFSFYRRLIQLRHINDIVAAGEFEAVDVEDEFVYAFTRSIDSQRVLAVVNVSSRTVPLPVETSLMLASGIEGSKVLIANEDSDALASSIAKGELSPWTAFVYQI